MAWKQSVSLASCGHSSGRPPLALWMKCNTMKTHLVTNTGAEALWGSEGPWSDRGVATSLSNTTRPVRNFYQTVLSSVFTRRDLFCWRLMLLQCVGMCRCYHLCLLVKCHSHVFSLSASGLFLALILPEPLGHINMHISHIIPDVLSTLHFQSLLESPPSWWVLRQKSMRPVGTSSSCHVLSLPPAGQPVRWLSTGLTGPRVEAHHRQWVYIDQNSAVL